MELKNIETRKDIIKWLCDLFSQVDRLTSYFLKGTDYEKIGKETTKYLLKFNDGFKTITFDLYFDEKTRFERKDIQVLSTHFIMSSITLESECWLIDYDIEIINEYFKLLNDDRCEIMFCEVNE